MVDGPISEGGKRTRVPKGIIPAFIAIALSLMMCVSATVMVSRATASISELEDRIDSLQFDINHLEGKLEVKNNMLDIKRIAVEEYGMISSEYASSRYIDIRADEVIKKYDGRVDMESWLTGILKAIGLVDD